MGSMNAKAIQQQLTLLRVQFKSDLKVPGYSTRRRGATMLDEAPSVNVVECIALHGKFSGKRTAFVCGERRVTWADFNALVDAIASRLKDKGLKKGDKVALL